MALKKQHLRIVNHSTGEIADYRYGTIQEAEAIYMQLKADLNSLKRAEIKLLDYIGKQVDDRYDFGDGKGMWIPKSKKIYRKEVVRRYLDEDQYDSVTVIDPAKLKDFFKQLVMDGKGIPGAWTDIEATAEVVQGKSYFIIRKGAI